MQHGPLPDRRLAAYPLGARSVPAVDVLTACRVAVLRRYGRPTRI